MNAKFYCKSVILTNGTFLNGFIHIGRIKFEGGRISEPSSKGISDQLELNLEVGRIKLELLQELTEEILILKY